MKNKELLKNACLLNELSNQLEVIVQLLDMLDYQKVKKDHFPIHYFLENQGLNLIGENLVTISEKLQQVSNALCPKVMEEGK